MTATIASPRARARDYLILLVLAQVALLLTGAWLWQHDRDGNTGPTLVPLDPSLSRDVPLTIEAGFPAALERARQWSAGARLFGAQLQIDWPTDPAEADTTNLPASGWIIYLFAAPRDDIGDDAAVYSLMVDRSSGVVIATETTGWTRLPERGFDLPNYPIASTVALYAAEITGGSDYRLACPQHRHLTRLGLSQSQATGEPAWVVTYVDSRFPNEAGMRVEVDARTGAISTIQPASDSCE